tara:strand:- start:46 stop:1293 length:1248 start_codon:yes stop_codon:yes gene_type:complete
LGKKYGGLQYSALILLIVAGISLYLFVAFYGGFASVVKATTEDEVCRTSVALKYKTSTVLSEGLTSLKCPMRDVESNAKTSEEVMFELASEMYRCWYKFGEGGLDFYSDVDFWGSESHCLICSKIRFENKDAGTVNLRDFSSYISGKKLPGHDETFAEYFTNAKNSRIMLSDEDGAASTPLPYGEPIYVVFRVNKHSDVGAPDVPVTNVIPEYAAGMDLASSSVIAGSKVVAAFAPEAQITQGAVATLADDTIFLHKSKNTGQFFLRNSKGQFVRGLRGTFASEKVAGEALLKTKGVKLAKLSSSKTKSLVGRVAAGTLKASGKTVVAVAKVGLIPRRVATKFTGTILKSAAKKVGVSAAAGTVAPGVGNVIGAVAGVVWTIADVTVMAGHASGYYPSIAIYSVDQIEGVCDSLS